jgi:hypothetical protein
VRSKITAGIAKQQSNKNPPSTFPLKYTSAISFRNGGEFSIFPNRIGKTLSAIKGRPKPLEIEYNIPKINPSKNLNQTGLRYL